VEGIIPGAFGYFSRPGAIYLDRRPNNHSTNTSILSEKRLSMYLFCLLVPNLIAQYAHQGKTEEAKMKLYAKGLVALRVAESELDRG